MDSVDYKTRLIKDCRSLVELIDRVDEFPTEGNALSHFKMMEIVTSALYYTLGEEETIKFTKKLAKHLFGTNNFIV
jgi:hypothetical protein